MEFRVRILNIIFFIGKYSSFHFIFTPLQLTVCASKSKKWRRRIDWSPLLLCSLLVLTISPPTSPQPRDWLELLIRRVQISFSYRSCSRAITFAKHKGRIISSSKTISGASNHCHDAESCKGAGSSYTS